jgi:predicted GIY-YIG superfamily endonuclease
MHTVYILRSLKRSGRIYIGYTTDLDRRLQEHNQGASVYTKPFAPWEVETAITFKRQALAKAFESYLKSGSGHAFLHKRLIA